VLFLWWAMAGHLPAKTQSFSFSSFVLHDPFHRLSILLSPSVHDGSFFPFIFSFSTCKENLSLLFPSFHTREITFVVAVGYRGTRQRCIIGPEPNQTITSPFRPL